MAHTLPLSCTGVLAGKGERRLLKGRHRHIDKTLDALRGSIPGHGGGTEGIDCRLQNNVGQGKHHALYAGRQPDF